MKKLPFPRPIVHADDAPEDERPTPPPPTSGRHAAAEPVTVSPLDDRRDTPPAPPRRPPPIPPQRPEAPTPIPHDSERDLAEAARVEALVERIAPGVVQKVIEEMERRRAASAGGAKKAAVDVAQDARISDFDARLERLETAVLRASKNSGEAASTALEVSHRLSSPAAKAKSAAAMVGAAVIFVLELYRTIHH